METRDTSNWETSATIHGMERMLSVIGTNGPKTIRSKDNLQISLTQQILIQTQLGPRRTEECGQGRISWTLISQWHLVSQHEFGSPPQDEARIDSNVNTGRFGPAQPTVDPKKG